MGVFVTLSYGMDRFGTHLIRGCVSQGFMRIIVIIYKSKSEEYVAWGT